MCIFNLRSEEFNFTLSDLYFLTKKGMESFMRVRNRPGAAEMLAAHPDLVISEPTKWKGKWHELFGNDQPIHIEIGMGKGQFITGMAKAHPEINYIGVEMQVTLCRSL